MQTVNIHEAKTHLSRLLEQVVQGQPFIIAKAAFITRVMDLARTESRR
jgi:prevent-host-death family protein